MPHELLESVDVPLLTCGLSDEDREDFLGTMASTLKTAAIPSSRSPQA